MGLFVSLAHATILFCSIMFIWHYSKRLPLDQWWLKLRPLLRILAKHDDVYTAEAEDDDQ